MTAEFGMSLSESTVSRKELVISPLALAIGDRMIKDELEVYKLATQLTGSDISFRNYLILLPIRKQMTSLVAQGRINGTPFTYGEVMRRALKKVDYKNLRELKEALKIPDSIGPEDIEIGFHSAALYASNNDETKAIHRKEDEIGMRLIRNSIRIADDRGLTQESIFRMDELYFDLIKRSCTPSEYINTKLKSFRLLLSPSIQEQFSIKVPSNDNKSTIATAEIVGFKTVERIWGHEEALETFPQISSDVA